MPILLAVITISNYFNSTTTTLIPTLILGTSITTCK